MTAAPVLAAEPVRGRESLLSKPEQAWLGVRLTLSLFAAGCLLISAGLKLAAPSQRDVAELVAGVAALIVAVPALVAAWSSLRHPDLHGVTDQLVALALIAAWAHGDLITAALLPLVMTVGHFLEERSLLGSGEAIRALRRLTKTRARRLSPSGEAEEVEAQALRVGDRIELFAGDVIPADGLVLSGVSSIDTASITGESVPIEVAPGARVLTGSFNIDGHLVVEITQVGDDTALGRVIALLQQAEQAKPPVARLLESHAERYMVLVLLLAAGTWFMTNSTVTMLAVLVASCPCALVLAAPATAVAAIAVASRHGILVKSAAFLENLATVDAIVFDKTGTVTLGQLQVIEARPEPGVDRHELTTLAGSLAALSAHPVSRALAPLASDQERLTLEEVRETRGLGVLGRIGRDVLALGRAELFQELGIAPSARPRHDGPIAGVSRGDRFLGWVLLADEPRPEAREAIADLRRLGLGRQLLLTGDRLAVARRIADLLDLPEFRAEALPSEKMQCVLQEIEAGYRPLVVGDGINDSLALKVGAVGIAMGAQGTDVALASADLVLMTNDLRRLGTCIRLSRRCRRTIYANVALGLGWTVVIVSCAAAGLLGASGAIVAAVLHNFSTLLVLGNAGRLLKFQETL
ncbi:MAG: cation-translocating P-type ATPase [Acetobacteraceae bacterium]|nr:cation-translocating P-type ATPase [Acetobacteraceae bacterium]